MAIFACVTFPSFKQPFPFFYNGFYANEQTLVGTAALSDAGKAMMPPWIVA